MSNNLDQIWFWKNIPITFHRGVPGLGKRCPKVMNNYFSYTTGHEYRRE